MPTVLVVDDAAADRRLAGGLLEKNSELQVRYAKNGREALEVLENDRPDVVLTDLQMPEVDGLALVESIRADYPLIPVILMTAQGSEEIAVRALESGASSYVPKRMLSQELLETVERVLSASGEERGQSRLLGKTDRIQVEFTLENDVTLISSLAAYVRRIARGMNFGEDSDHLRLGIALEEALLNAYYHGNLEVSSELREVDYSAYYQLAKERSQQSPYQERKIYVEVTLSPSEVNCSIRDEGPGFDREALPDPTDPMNLDRPSGRGILLMKTFMDEVTYNDVGNEVQLVKRRQSEPLVVIGAEDDE